MNWIDALPDNRRRGSFPRCLIVTDGEPGDVAHRLETLVSLPELRITANDHWMPCGVPQRGPDGEWDLSPTAEAELGNATPFLTDEQRHAVTDWWLAENHTSARTPNWDIASTCTIEGKSGLLLIEAKAHDEELNAESSGKRLDKNASARSIRNHASIGQAIAEANTELVIETGFPWTLDRDSHYQISNRFAWSWKLTALGFPVVLVYLGFLDADEMSDRGVPFSYHGAWEALVRSHNALGVPAEVWGQKLWLNGQVFVPLIRSMTVPLDPT